MNQDIFAGPEGLDLYGKIMFCTMLGAFMWLLLATKYSLPVSTTHSLVGALIGVGIWEKGLGGVNLAGLFTISKFNYT